jgi:uncharacterized protein (DUF1330 family)
MKTAYVITLSLLVGIAIGGLGVQTLYARTRPPAFLVADNEVSDMDAFVKEFVPVADRAQTAAGGKYLARGKPEILVGDTKQNRIAIIRFASMDDLKRWWSNPEFQVALKAAEKYTKFHNMAIEGVGQ